jgi:hypothetical protein
MVNFIPRERANLAARNFGDRNRPSLEHGKLHKKVLAAVKNMHHCSNIALSKAMLGQVSRPRNRAPQSNANFNLRCRWLTGISMRWNSARSFAPSMTPNYFTSRFLSKVRI